MKIKFKDDDIVYIGEKTRNTLDIHEQEKSSVSGTPGQMVGSPGSRLLVPTPLCDALPWSMGGTYNLLLTNGIPPC